MVGFDHKISLNPIELKEMINNIRNIEKMFGSTLKQVSKNEEINKNKYHVSIVSKDFIPKGKFLNLDDIAYKNPGTGIQPKDINKILGKKVSKDIKPDTLIEFSDFE